MFKYENRMEDDPQIKEEPVLNGGKETDKYFSKFEKSINVAFKEAEKEAEVCNIKGKNWEKLLKYLKDKAYEGMSLVEMYEKIQEIAGDTNISTKDLNSCLLPTLAAIRQKKHEKMQLGAKEREIKE